MLSQECCPQCQREVVSSRVRLVQDSCGHRKCRECLLNEELGCLMCSRMPVYPDLSPTEPADLSLHGPLAGTSSYECCAASDPVTPDPPEATDCEYQLEQLEPLNLTESFRVLSVRQEEEEQAKKQSPTVTPEKKVATRKPPVFGLKDHIVFTPGDPPTYLCLRCNKSYNNRKSARYHNYCGAPDEEKPHTCDECGQGFVTKGHLDYHLNSHAGVFPFHCQFCNKGFPQVSKLNRHLKSHEGPSGKSFRCNVCEKSLSTEQDLKDHMLSHSESQHVTCPMCNKKLSSQSCLRKHRKLHADPAHKCKDCGKTFPLKWNFDVHMKSHQRERKFKCKVCNRAFKIRSDLKRHAFVHREKKEWDCKECSIIFRRRDNLVRHMKNIHPEAPLILPKRQGTKKDSEETEVESGKHKEVVTENSTFTPPSNAVSVIRGPAVPVIQKAEAKASTSKSGLSSYVYLEADRMKEQTSEMTSKDDLNSESRGSGSSMQPGHQLVVAAMDQNYHRESVVCHSDSRGVVHHGSASLENAGTSKTGPNDSSKEVPLSDEQVYERDSNTSENPSDNRVIQSNIVQRPEVIVSKKPNK